ncbi:hypothetical protein [Smaragdicoccus niigatensis]|uniref:hypothetical protein n=1 Tax=Smaragdicoccus niigatensis TaxID=359359 RepID=UPI00036578DC|nr:hypothetical protein [Smaragdicoccus niigatensis]
MTTKGMASRRLITVLIAFFVIVGFATARSVAKGEGNAVPARGTIEFTPASNPIRVQAAAGHIFGLTWVDANKSIPLAGGRMSQQDTYYLRFEYLTADGAAITQNVNGRSLTLTNLNGGDPNTAARLGAEGTTVDVWSGVASLDLCVTAETFYTIINGYSGLLGGSVAPATALVASIFAPAVGTPLGKAGPCISLVKLLPLLTLLVQAGVPLPNDLPAVNIDLTVYAGNIAAGPGVNALSLPVARLEVAND